MNGPQNYAEAERCIRAAATFKDGSASSVAYLAIAQVHALLALAAAAVDCGPPCGNATLWAQVTQ